MSKVTEINAMVCEATHKFLTLNKDVTNHKVTTYLGHKQWESVVGCPDAKWHGCWFDYETGLYHLRGCQLVEVMIQDHLKIVVE